LTFFVAANEQAKRFMSDEHFTVDGTLIQAWASQKSFRKKDGSEGDGANFHDSKRSNETHESTTDPDARLYKKSYGRESKLAYLGHALVENRNGLIAAAMATQADGYAEREAALLMLADKQQGRSRRITVGADKAYDAKDFVTAARALNVTPHIAKNNTGRRSNMDGRTTRHAGYAISLSCRWLVEKPFAWLKQTAGLAQVKVRGLAKVDCAFVFGCAAHNLLRLRNSRPKDNGEAPTKPAKKLHHAFPNGPVMPETSTTEEFKRNQARKSTQNQHMFSGRHVLQQAPSVRDGGFLPQFLLPWFQGRRPALSQRGMTRATRRIQCAPPATPRGRAAHRH
jgi:hypothetical protein